jgi:putative methylase
LAIGAKLVGARLAVGVDSAAEAVAAARRNASRLNVEVEWHLAEVRETRGKFETVLMNPPFGSQTRHADRAFFETAARVGGVVYAFLNSKAEAFVRDVLESGSRRITDRVEYRFPIPHMFKFHRDEVRHVDVVLYRAEVAKE